VILSRTSEYAVRASLFVASQPATALVRVADVAAALDIPRNYLSKIFHTLTRAGLLASTRGKLGGFRLARPPQAITLLDVVSRFDDMTGTRQCLLGRSVCSDRTPCMAHRGWQATSEAVAAFFRETTIADLLREAPIREDAA
jgi:Rrf2 family protein